MMKTIKRVKLCLIAVLAVVFVSMSCALVATNVKRAAAVSLGSETFVMDDTGLTLRTNNQVGPRFKVKMEKGLADRIKTENITLSFLIAPRAAFDKVNYNYETLLSAAKAATGTSAPARIQVADKAKIYEEGDYSWASLVINTGEANRTLDMSVVAYITYSDGNGSLINRFAATDVEKVRGNLYNVVNTTALSDAVLAKDILGNSEFGWYGAGNYPIEISTTEQAEVLKNSGADFSGKVVLADSSVNIPSEISGNVKTVTEQAVGGNKAEIVLGSGTSYAVDMGTLDGNVVKATIGGKAVSYADGKVTLDFDFKNRLIKHGEQTLTVTVEKDGQYHKIHRKMKERFEWVQSWCDEALSDYLPRVLLIGDSITRQYQDRVRELLRGKCYVDYFSSSYAADSPLYRTLIKAFIRDAKYSVIHFNNGLHGFHVGKRTYKSRLKKLLKAFPNDCKVILASTTFVFEEGNVIPDKAWGKRVSERNAAIDELSEEFGFSIDDLYSVSKTIDASGRSIDGTHFNEEGVDILTDSVVKSILNVWDNQ